MPRFVIERQYLIPIFEHICLEAPDLGSACREAVDDIAQPWTDNAVLDFDCARPVTVTQAVEIPESLFSELQGAEDEDRDTLSAVLYSSGLDFLAISPEFGEPSARGQDQVGFS